MKGPLAFFLCLALTPATVRGQCLGGVCPIGMPPPQWLPARGQAPATAALDQQYPKEPIPPTIPRQLVAASVRVWIVPGGTGSGTVVHVNAEQKTGIVLTNRHVVEGHRTLNISFPSGKTVTGVVHKVDTTADLAMLTFAADGSTPFVPLADAAPVRGKAVFQVGYPQGKGPIARAGHVVGYMTADPFDQFVPSIETEDGDSGSGIFLASENALCGVVYGGPKGTKDTWCVTLKDIQRFCSFLPNRPTSPGTVPPATQRPHPPADVGGYAPTRPWTPADTPPVPATQTCPPSCTAAADRKAIAELHRRIDELQFEVAKANASGKIDPSLLAGLGDRLRNLELHDGKLTSGHEGVHLELGKLKEMLSGVIGQAGTPPEIAAKVEGLAARLPKLAAEITALAGALEGSAGLAGLLVPIGAATGGVGVPVILGGWVALQLLRRWRRRAQPAGHTASPAPGSSGPGAPPPPGPDSVTGPHPANPQPSHEVKFVGYEAPSEELARHLQAMAIVGKEWPALQGAINLLQSTAKQLKPQTPIIG